MPADELQSSTTLTPKRLSADFRGCDAPSISDGSLPPSSVLTGGGTHDLAVNWRESVLTHVDPTYVRWETLYVQSQSISELLLRWYDKGHRILPWRRNPFSQVGPRTPITPGHCPCEYLAQAVTSRQIRLHVLKHGGYRMQSRRRCNADTRMFGSNPYVQLIYQISRTVMSVNLSSASSEAVAMSARWAPLDLPPQQFAYRVWVSEVMLQQTRVETVTGFYDRTQESAQAEQRRYNSVTLAEAAESARCYTYVTCVSIMSGGEFGCSCESGSVMMMSNVHPRRPMYSTKHRLYASCCRHVVDTATPVDRWYASRGP
eukprot:1196346-Prorocentrum_minimum.AAC.2